jgi:hypothetical protein
MVLIGAVLLAVNLWPEIRRLRKLQRQNDEFRREHDQLVRQNHEQAGRILERWQPPEATN